MTQPIALCLQCGAENVIATGSCAQCQSKLVRGRVAGGPRTLVASVGKGNGAGGWIVGGLVLLGIIALNQNNNTSNYQPAPAYSPAPAYDASLAQVPPSMTIAPAFSAPPVIVSDGIVWSDETLNRSAPLEIVTPSGTNYFIKLVEHETGRPIMTIFLSGGSRREFLVPLGNFEMRFASGQTWYGEEFLFGPDTQYSRAERAFEFYETDTEILGHTIELIRQANGNLNTADISADQF